MSSGFTYYMNIASLFKIKRQRIMDAYNWNLILST